MLDGYRRGCQVASEMRATVMLPGNLPTPTIAHIAGQVLAEMRNQQAAHLDPESEFIGGFVACLQIAQQEWASWQ